MTRLALGAILGAAWASSTPLATAAQLGLLFALAFVAGKLLSLPLDALP
jgi:hypothetical protein